MIPLLLSGSLGEPSLLYIHNLILVRTVRTEGCYRMPFVILHPTD